jgi:PAS domain-containing protein
MQRTGNAATFTPGSPTTWNHTIALLVGSTPTWTTLPLRSATVPGSKRQAANLRALIHQKLSELAQTISLYQSGDAAGAKALVMSDKGFKVMESIRALVGQMEQEETRVGELRRAAYRKSIRITFVCIYAASAVAALGIIWLALFIMRESERRERDAAALRRSEEWFRVTLSSIGDGVIVTDDQGFVSSLNPVAERLTGTSLAQAKGDRIGDVFPIFSEVTNKPAENPSDAHRICAHAVLE